MRFLEFKPLKESVGPLEVPAGSDQSKLTIALQKALAAFNYDVHTTGILDDRTSQAIAKAQQDLGLPMTGKPDPTFIRTMNSSILNVPDLGKYISDVLAGLRKEAEPTTAAITALTGANAVSNTPTSTPTSTPNTSPVDKTTNVQSSEKIKPVKSTSPLAKDPKFLAKVDEVAGKLGIDPNILMKIMQHESTLNPKAINQIGCVGLIQFCHDDTVGVPRSTIRKMDAISQMDLVYKYYKKVGVQPGMTQGEIYMLTFVPWAKNKDRNTVIGQKGGGRLAPNINISKNELWKDNPKFAQWAAAQGRDYYTKGDVIDYFKHYQT